MIKSPSERLNTQRGIRHCHGRADIYLQILQHFVAQYEQSQPFAELLALPADDAIRWLHTLKGHSATIGAAALSEHCRALQASWPQATPAELERGFIALSAELALICADVKQVIQLYPRQN